MASFKNNNPPITIIDGFDNSEIADQLHIGVFLGGEEGTRVMHPGGGGGIDPFTKELSGTVDVWANISGIVGQVNEMDSLLGASGRVKVGMLKVTYHYPTISGIIMEDLQAVQILTPNLSGVYFVQGMTVDVVADTPVFVDLALGNDPNG